MSIKFTDRAQVGSIKKTQEGYLVASSRVARTGVQDYLASELGMAYSSFPPERHVMVNGMRDAHVYVGRPESEVFSKDALASLSRVPVTLNHPDVPVTAENWKDLAVGEVGDNVLRDGDWIVVNPMIKDAKALIAAETTHKEISMGYTAELVDADPDSGADFDMVNVRFNHLALVPKGRAGSHARIGDAAKWGVSPVTVEDTEMTVELKTVVLGDASVEVKASDAATVAAILKDHKTIVDAKDGEIGRLTAKLADAQSKVLTDAQIADMVAAKVEADKKLEAVRAKFGDEAVKDATPAMIDGMFRVIDKAVAVDDSARAVFGDKKQIEDAETKIRASQNKFLNPEQK